MAISDATAYPVKGQAFSTSGVITSSATSNPITGGLGTIYAQYSLDRGTFTDTTNHPQEIGASGYWSLDLLPGEMNGSTVLIRVTAPGAPGAVEFAMEINPMDLTEPTGRYDAQSVVRFEQLFTQFY